MAEHPEEAAECRQFLFILDKAWRLQ